MGGLLVRLLRQGFLGMLLQPPDASSTYGVKIKKIDLLNLLYNEDERL